jgi:hypothetical protein
MYPLAAGFSFEKVPVGMTPVPKVENPLLLFAMGTVVMEYASNVLAEVEMEAEKVLGSFGPREYDALVAVNIPNGGRLNRVFEQIGVSYAPRSLLGSEASQGAIKYRLLKRQRLAQAKLHYQSQRHLCLSQGLLQRLVL